MLDLKSERVTILNNSNPRMRLMIAAMLCAFSLMLLGSTGALAQVDPEISRQRSADCRNRVASENIPVHERRKYLRRCMAGSGADGERGTPEQRAACMGDAFRFCSSEIPNIPRITACMEKNLRRLSPACRAQFR
jgi:hypothetical protein